MTAFYVLICLFTVYAFFAEPTTWTCQFMSAREPQAIMSLMGWQHYHLTVAMAALAYLCVRVYWAACRRFWTLLSVSWFSFQCFSRPNFKTLTTPICFADDGQLLAATAPDGS